MRRISASAVSSASRDVARTSTSNEQRSATTFGRVPPAIRPTLTVTSGQRPFRSWSSRMIRAASRIALRPFSGSTPACAARPWTTIRRSRIPLRADTMSPLARAHSSTSATSLSAASLADVRGRARRADLLVRIGDEDEPLEGQAAALVDDRLERVEARPAGRPSCR